MLFLAPDAAAVTVGVLLSAAVKVRVPLPNTYSLPFAVNELGDIYLVGRLPLDAVTEREIDRILGEVLQYADSSFNPLLELGFSSAIRREWAWIGRAHV